MPRSPVCVTILHYTYTFVYIYYSLSDINRCILLNIYQTLKADWLLTRATMSRCSCDWLKLRARSSMHRFSCWQVQSHARYSSESGTLSRKTRNASQMASWQTEHTKETDKHHSYFVISQFTVNSDACFYRSRYRGVVYLPQAHKLRHSMSQICASIVYFIQKKYGLYRTLLHVKSNNHNSQTDVAAKMNCRGEGFRLA